MKLKNIAKKKGKGISLDIAEARLTVTPNKEFEVSDKIGNELLNKKIDGNPVVERVTETKSKN